MTHNQAQGWSREQWSEWLCKIAPDLSLYVPANFTLKADVILSAIAHQRRLAVEHLEMVRGFCVIRGDQEGARVDHHAAIRAEVYREIAAKLLPPASGEDETEFKWLIETADQSHRYLVVGNPWNWTHLTDDPNKATAYESAIDAWAGHRSLYGDPIAKNFPKMMVAKHGFMKAKPPASGETCLHQCEVHKPIKLADGIEP